MVLKIVLASLFGIECSRELEALWTFFLQKTCDKWEFGMIWRYTFGFFSFRFVTLLPGDVILTGTPPGVGVFMKPPQFLKVCKCFYGKLFKRGFFSFCRRETSLSARSTKSGPSETKLFKERRGLSTYSFPQLQI